MYTKNSVFALVFVLFSAVLSAQTTKYKVLVQMKTYTGEGAYMTAYLVDGKGSIVKTLSVMGEENKWYKNLKQWYAAQSKKREKLDAITGASVAGGKRNIFTVAIDNTWMNKGYKIRFESAVEHGKYIPVEADVPVSSAAIEQKVDGTGYVRFIKFNKL